MFSSTLIRTGSSPPFLRTGRFSSGTKDDQTGMEEFKRGVAGIFFRSFRPLEPDQIVNLFRHLVLKATLYYWYQDRESGEKLVSLVLWPFIFLTSPFLRVQQYLPALFFLRYLCAVLLSVIFLEVIIGNIAGRAFSWCKMNHGSRRTVVEE